MNKKKIIKYVLIVSILSTSAGLIQHQFEVSNLGTEYFVKKVIGRNLDKLPQGWTIKLVDDIDEDKEGLSDRHGNDFVASGVTNYDTKTILIDNKYKDERTVLHEIGHAVLDSSSYSIENMSISAFAIAEYDGTVLKNKHAMFSYKEYFAESYAQYCLGNKVDEQMEEILKELVYSRK